MPIATFLRQDVEAVLGNLTARSDFDVGIPQRNAWVETIDILQEQLADIRGHIYLEFDVPRLGSRIDAVVVSGPAVFPIEMKVGESDFPRGAINQAWDYALDLKNFHQASHAAPILPVLVATEAPLRHESWARAHSDGVRPPRCCSKNELAATISEGLALEDGADLDCLAWGSARYNPTPTIVEAARAMYSRHSVEAISRNDAGARNLAVTSKRVEQVIDEARKNRRKAIIFVTGVPGAGKTLVGLNVATHRRDESSATHAVFLSGNAPLVAVLREALVRDECKRRRARGEEVRKGVVAQPVKQFIQNVHHFRDDGLKHATAAPHDHVVIFDEAQRAWDHTKASDFMRRRKNLIGFTQSEPEFLIAYMDRHVDWAVILCLVGGGQEIHTGEAGISAWLDAVRDHFPEWHVYVSPRLKDQEYAALETINSLPQQTAVSLEPDLHLSVSLRSFRAERVSAFVKTVLDMEKTEARQLLTEITERYPIALTRDLSSAKKWIREHARGSERFGLVASSQAARLKPLAIDIRVEVDPVKWFLNDAMDTRSSCYLEDAATEFQIQGLELDWACVTWDADLRYGADGWSYHQFRGRKWERCKKPVRQQYMVNAYRVLLTRARQGMVILVPHGDPGDPTRDPAFYDGTYDYLRGLGLVSLGS